LSSAGDNKNTRRNIIVVIVIAIAAAAVIGIVAIASQTGSQSDQISGQQQSAQFDTSSDIPVVFSPDSEQYGKSYGEWTAAWWTWALSIPSEISPLDDPTGKNCHQGQEGPVWFLAGTTGGYAERKCTVPAGKAILIPAINAWCDYAGYPNLKTPEDLQKCAKADQDMVIEKEAIIDGKRVQDLDKYRVAYPLFNVTFPEGNPYGVRAGQSQAASDGFWVFLPPLSPGEHEIHVKGALGDFTATSTITFATEAKYHITVK
jgi:hypothetical protein